MIFLLGMVMPSLVLADARKELEAAYRDFNAAMKARDVKKVMAFTTPDFKMVNVGKVVFSRMELRTSLEQSLKQFKTILSVTSKIERMQSDKFNVISVRSTGTFKAEIVNPTTKKVGIYESTSVTDDVWVKSKEGWRLKQVRTVKEDSRLDGRKVGGS